MKTGEIREIASLTKTMTCLVVFRLIKRFNLNPLELYFSVTLGASETIGRGVAGQIFLYPGYPGRAFSI